MVGWLRAIFLMLQRKVVPNQTYLSHEKNTSSTSTLDEDFAKLRPFGGCLGAAGHGFSVESRGFSGRNPPLLFEEKDIGKWKVPLEEEFSLKISFPLQKEILYM